MYLNLIERTQGSCSPGFQFYVCQANGFSGCCSVDACNLPTCPDTTSSSSSSETTTITLTTEAPTVVPFLTTPAATQTQSPSSSSSVSSSTSSNTTPTVSQASQTASLNDAGAAPTKRASSTSTSTTQLAAGSTSTPVPVSSGGSSKAPIIAGVVAGVVGAAIISILIWFFLRRRKQKKLMANSPPMFGTDGKEKFAMDSPDSGSTEEPVNNDVFAPFGGYHRTPSQTEHQRQSTRSMEIETQDEGEDAPLPSIEKHEVIQPPIHEHPAYHPLPGQSPEVPTYVPGSPAYPSQNQHPAFTPSTAPVHPAFRTYSPVHLDSTPIIPQNEMEGFPSPITSRIELPASMPRPLFSSSNLAHPALLRPQNRPGSNLASRNTSTTTTVRTGTSSSMYSIPIGLGVDGANQMEGPVRPSLSTKRVQPNLRRNLSTRESNEREHVMSWATYGGTEMGGKGEMRREEVSPIMGERWSGSSTTPLSPMGGDGWAAR